MFPTVKVRRDPEGKPWLCVWALQTPGEGPEGRDLLWQVYSPEGEVAKEGWVRDPKTANDSSLRACKAHWRAQEPLPEEEEDPVLATAREILHWNDGLPAGVPIGGRAGAMIYLQGYYGMTLKEALDILSSL